MSDLLSGQSPEAGSPHGLDSAVRRETSSSRAYIAAAVAVVVALACAYLLLESTLQAFGQPAWLIDPESAARRVAGLPAGTNRGLLGLIGAVLVMVGFMLVVVAVRPGRRGRRSLPGGKVAVVVDDEVLASAIARRARAAAVVRPEQVTVWMTEREAVVNVRPTSGVPVRAEDVLVATEDELARLRPEPYPQLRVRVEGSGVVGA
ncbi:hypothetical protein SCMU_04160 [Sinomonas cyclohexanicum]|uniref:Alkaline shock response membrane anchor protein AmaP n=1 Tax=Sinomonas cyclohexanicum TaxID=322009 RepID=A0ABN6FDE3_SINCY|nr:DUF6286 domain-containing protein [Corynebacterium cyclohexanicum]BCT74574.1 hypothetical protein SCMU_04160 [Corynebacterium cyclohexanicum]